MVAAIAQPAGLARRTQSGGIDAAKDNVALSAYFLLCIGRGGFNSHRCHSKRGVIPAKAGIHASYWRWIPAFAGMTPGGKCLAASDQVIPCRGCHAYAIVNTAIINAVHFGPSADGARQNKGRT
jgi:hypothetical protein